MAADLHPEWISCLPPYWSYGVTRDGRVFFVNEEAKSTTWLHPVSGEAVITGHRKTPDLPTGWEEGFTFEGARCFINHNERKVTCKHPVSGIPSQDNCIFVVNEHVNCGHLGHSVFGRSAQTAPANEKKDRFLSDMSEASNYTGASDYATHQNSPAGRPSRPSKKVHNFGKRSNSIRRNPGAPVIRSNWLYKQDSTGMKLWKKRWFVLSDLCLFYYRDEKEEGILGSILLPSFHVSMLSVDDHINRKYAFKATHPNMRTYYFCTDTPKEMEAWMRAMTEAALVHSEPVKRLERLQVEQCGPQDIHHLTPDAQRPPLTHPEIQNNERNREADRAHPAISIPIPAPTLNIPSPCPTPSPTTPTGATTPTPEEQERRQREAERYGFQNNGGENQRPLTKINSLKLQPAQAAALTAGIVTHPRTPTPTETDGPYRGATPQVNGGGGPGNHSPGGDGSAVPTPRPEGQGQGPERSLSRTSSMLQLEQWVRTQRGRGQDEDTRSITSYQTLPRNMPSYRAPAGTPQPGEGYRTMPRNGLGQRDSICSMSPSMYEQALGPGPGDKRRSMRDDTMWQLFEWQQRNAYARPPSAMYANMPSPKTMINLSEHAPPAHAIPPSPSHGSLAMYGGYSPLRSYNMGGARSEVSSPVYRGGDMSMDRRLRQHPNNYAYTLHPDRRSMPSGLPVQIITAQSLQGKTLSPDDYRAHTYMSRQEEADVDTKLSRLCEQDKVVRAQGSKVQQLHREKHTLETALLSASQEIELGSGNPAAMQSVIQQRDLLQSGLLSTCRELTRVSAEMERSWRDYDRLEGDVNAARTNLLEQLEALGSPQTEPPSQQHVNIQKELWRIQDVMEALSKHRPQRPGPDGCYSSVPMTEGPDYRLYKSEPELTTVAEVDESNGEDRSGGDHLGERESSASRGVCYPVGIVPPRTKSPMMDSSSIGSYVTLRKSRRPESRNDRPRSAADQLGGSESARPRMSVEEQLERIRRHQQGALREKKKGGRSVLGGGQENTPSRSPSFTRETPPRSTQLQSRRREDVMGNDILELENSLRMQDVVRDQETPAQEIARLKEASQHFNMDRELSVPDKVVIPERYVESDPEDAPSPEQEADKQRKVDRIKALIARNSMQNAPPNMPVSPEQEAEVEAEVQEKEKMINISYELAAEASKRSKLVAVKSLSSSTPVHPPLSPNTPLPDGTHFMCV
ncbi:pleckstrin homology domain-containing family A member 5 isoform X7 [Gadus morhua]|uniref:pleckstrin homology domain-containing family A member 5 isoform X7 n=1 Tax=Gadus morhua TaxID=8049 RepID=UPI0011B7048F|nr:pleckstrin homology domain-containing family A member 5 isoform X7 [Gadus morhua]